MKYIYSKNQASHSNIHAVLNFALFTGFYCKGVLKVFRRFISFNMLVF